MFKYSGYPVMLFQGETDGGGAPPVATPSSGSPTPDAGPTSPTSEASGTDTSSSTPEVLDFESIFEGGDRDSGQTAPPELTTQPAKVPPASAPPVQQPVAPPVQPVQPPPPAQPQVQQQPQGQPRAGLAGLDVHDPAQLASALAANEAQMVDVLSTQVFNLSPQEVEALETNVVEAIPRLMARVLVQAQKSMLTQMARIMPAAIQRHNVTTNAAMSAEDQFYRAVPSLDRTKHGQLVYAYGRMFRQMYPTATLQDLIAHVGPMVMASAGIQPGQQTPQRGVATNGRQPPPSPFTPAGGHAGPASRGSPMELSPVEAMFMGNE